MSFASVPVRGNLALVTSAWWNALRTAGIAMENRFNTWVGAGSSASETEAAIANNQTDANVTGLIASDAYRVTRVWYWARRVATDDVMEAGVLTIIYNGTNFYLGRHFIETETTAGLDFDVDPATGQVIYDSSNMAGVYDPDESKISWMLTTQGTI
jgi:hypothetical protein